MEKDDNWASAVGFRQPQVTSERYRLSFFPEEKVIGRYHRAFKREYFLP